MKAKMSLIPLLIFASASAWAQSGTRGGGESMPDLTNKPSLRELVDKTVCVVQSTRRFAKDTRYEEIQNKIWKAHSYLGFALNREMKLTSVCMSDAPLVRVSADDQRYATIYLYDVAPGKRAQAAVRIGNRIYIDGTIYRGDAVNPGMDLTSQSYLILHELLHGLIPMDRGLFRHGRLQPMTASELADRQGRLMEFVKFIWTYDREATIDSDDLAVNIRQAGIEMLEKVTAEFKKIQDPLFEMVSPEAGRPSRLAGFFALNNSDYLLIRRLELPFKLLRQDMELLAKTEDEVSESIQKVLTTDDAAAITSLLEAGMNPNLYVKDETHWNAKNERSPLIYEAAKSCRSNVIRELLKSPKTDPNQARKYDYEHSYAESALYAATTARCYTVSEMLLADPRTDKTFFKTDNGEKQSWGWSDRSDFKWIALAANAGIPVEMRAEVEATIGYADAQILATACAQTSNPLWTTALKMLMLWKEPRADQIHALSQCKNVDVNADRLLLRAVDVKNSALVQIILAAPSLDLNRQRDQGKLPSVYARKFGTSGIYAMIREAEKKAGLKD